MIRRMKHITKPLTLGDLIADLYKACGKRRAQGILRLAVDAELIVFRGPDRCVFGRANRKV
jgi:hypothetical protein